MIVNMHEAKTNLSKLVDQVNKGEEVILARAGKPVAKIVPVDQPRNRDVRRRIGLFAGQDIWMADDFDDLPEDIARAFQESEIEP